MSDFQHGYLYAQKFGHLLYDMLNKEDRAELAEVYEGMGMDHALGMAAFLRERS